MTSNRWLSLVVTALVSGLTAGYVTHIAAQQLIEESETLVYRVRFQCEEQVFQAYEQGWRNAAMGTCASSR